MKTKIKSIQNRILLLSSFAVLSGCGGLLARAVPPTVEISRPDHAKVAVLARLNDVDMSPGHSIRVMGGTHKTIKSLSLSLNSLTGLNMEVAVKITFLAKDEASGEIRAAKTFDQPISLTSGKSQQLTTEEVSFERSTFGAKFPPHSAKHPAIRTGDVYFGYKVEVFEGPLLVGAASSESR